MEKKVEQFLPREYQRIAIEAVCENDRIGLFLDMGLGKTVSVLTALDRLMHEEFEVFKVLVIAPLQVAKTTWTDEIDKWDHLRGKFKVNKVLGSQADRLRALEDRTADIYIVNRENVVWLVDELGKGWFFDCIVVDELSSFKNSKAKRFRALRKVIPLANRVIGMTGTPASNGLLDLWAEMYVIDGGKSLGKTLTNYRDRYFKPGRRNGHIVFDWVLKDGAEEEIWDRLKEVTVTMKSEDWLTLPDLIEIPIKVDLPKKAMRMYNEMKKDRVLEIEESSRADGGSEATEGSEDVIIADTASVLYGKLCQLASGCIYREDGSYVAVHEAKLEALDELVEAAQGENLLVMTNFVFSKERILARYDNAVELSSEESIREFQLGKTGKVYVSNPLTIGHGLNLQNGGSVIIWYDLPTSLEAFLQANKRLYRSGQKNTVRQYYILADGTIDEYLLELLRSKTMTQDRLIEALKVNAWEV